MRPAAAMVLMAAVLALAVAPTARLDGSSMQAGSAAIPVEQEPRHHLVFSNAHVRVIDALLPPLYVSAYHAHAVDHVAITIVPGREDAQGQSRIGFAGFARGGYAHVVTNPANAPMRFIDIELLAPDPGAETVDDALVPNHEVVLSNGRTRIVRVKLEPGQSLPEHRHGEGYVSVVVRGGDGPGVWRWRGSADGNVPLAAGTQPFELVEVEPR